MRDPLFRLSMGFEILALETLVEREPFKTFKLTERKIETLTD